MSFHCPPSTLRKWILYPLAALFLFMSVAVLLPQKAQACCSCISTTAETEAINWLTKIPLRTATHIPLRFEIHKRIFMRLRFWGNNLSVALRDMVEELSGVSMQQTLIVGSFIDAAHQMETQQVLQTLQARAHKDYQPSVGMCEFISNAKSLSDSDRKAELNQIFLSQRSQDRFLANANSASAPGKVADVNMRIQQYKTRFCNPRDHAEELAVFCTPEDNSPIARERLNKDIDYARTLAHPYSLNIDFTDSNLTNDEEEIIALSSNLYAQSVFKDYNASSLKVSGNSLSGVQKDYMDARSIVAKFSVAENSFNALAGLKSQGGAGSKEFIDAVFKQLGVSQQEIDKLVGENPSYYAQMDVLTKKLLQSPDFYTNLYDKPVNVERKGAALQAIGLMQKFDLFKSHLRNEANLSVLLELAVKDVQEKTENKINTSLRGGNPSVPD